MNIFRKAIENCGNNYGKPMENLLDIYGKSMEIHEKSIRNMEDLWEIHGTWEIFKGNVM